MTDSARKSWEDFYKIHYGLDLDFSEVLIPPGPSTPHLLAIIPMGLTSDQVFDALPFEKGRYCDCSFAQIAFKNDRTNAYGHYAAWLWPGFSFDKGGPGGYYVSEKVNITLLERLVLEHKCFVETGNHLASINCLASRGVKDTPCNVYVIRYGDHKGKFMVAPALGMGSEPIFE